MGVGSSRPEEAPEAGDLVTWGPEEAAVSNPAADAGGRLGRACGCNPDCHGAADPRLQPRTPAACGAFGRVTAHACYS